MKVKTAIAFILIFSVLTMSLFSCGTRPKIDDYEWHLRVAMCADEELSVLAVDESDNAHPDAKVVDVVLVAKDGKIAITDHTNDKIYEGEYKLSQMTPKGADYQITINGVSGYATVAMTTYSDGSEEPTLPINLGEYSLYFYAD